MSAYRSALPAAAANLTTPAHTSSANSSRFSIVWDRLVDRLAMKLEGLGRFQALLLLFPGDREKAKGQAMLLLQGRGEGDDRLFSERRGPVRVTSVDRRVGGLFRHGRLVTWRLVDLWMWKRAHDCLTERPRSLAELMGRRPMRTQAWTNGGDLIHGWMLLDAFQALQGLS